MESQDSLADVLPLPETSAPTTPRPTHVSIPDTTATAVAQIQLKRVEDATADMTPPPSTQVPLANKNRTPTPTFSHISTPPPTVEGASQTERTRPNGVLRTMSAEDIEIATPEELRAKLTEVQAALHEAKMLAAHHKLQYNMLLQESAAAIERMAVEARMAQYEYDVIHTAEHARVAVTPVQPSPFQEGMIPVQKEMYQRMCGEIQHYRLANQQLEREHAQQERLISRQEIEIASLTDKVTLMRERIRENREHLNKIRSLQNNQIEATPRSFYSTPQRGQGSQDQSQPFAALLQASEIASERMAFKKGHGRNTHSMSSLPATPLRMPKFQPSLFQTPSDRVLPAKVPFTAPMPRTSSMRTPDDHPVITQPPLRASPPYAPPSEGTVSNSDRDHTNDNDSEAETDIIEPEDNKVSESQASRVASRMLRSSQEHETSRNSFRSRGMPDNRQDDRMRQMKLFGSIRKTNVDRSEQPPTKKQKTDASTAVGLGIAGMKE
ncbi:MAG: hypothetical protein FE78DRAFT_85013 [Acidomyces sp. 'richmondensis']|nr:MAG: hypothetical protein FE78DRAFT_85013 [Acidomyces sp. 'richmondensis']